VKRAYEALDRRGLPLASNQVGYSLLNRKPERNGVLETCRELGVTVIAYGPLGEGILTGKYESKDPPLIRRVKWALRGFPALPPFIGLMREIGQQHGDASPAQVALNWCSAKGTVPIAGIKTAAQAKDNFAALEWQLTADEVAALDEATER
jgi:aryl-alcohol dehydrogenase-like predicted oxidoreductase